MGDGSIFPRKHCIIIYKYTHNGKETLSLLLGLWGHSKRNLKIKIKPPQWDKRREKSEIWGCGDIFQKCEISAFRVISRHLSQQ